MAPGHLDVAPEPTSSMHFFCSAEGRRFVGCILRVRGRIGGSQEQEPSYSTAQFPPSAVHPVPPHFGPMPALESQPVAPISHSPTQKSHPALPTSSRSKPPGTQPLFFNFLEKQNPKCRIWQNQRADGLALLGSHWNLGSGPSPGSTSALPSHRERPRQCPPQELLSWPALFLLEHSALRLLKSF